MLTIVPIPGFYEPVNSMLHLGAAAVFTVLGVLLVQGGRGDRLRMWLLGVFAGASVFLLSMSGVYHMLRGGSVGADVMVRLDQAAIFVLIAGTFTPVHGLLFRGAARWTGLLFMWAAAVTGATLMTVYHDDMPFALSTTLYIALGWAAGLSVIAAWRRRGFSYIRSILLGGIAYSLGAILLSLEWPTLIPSVFGPHELWHIAVITGLALHWRFIAQLARDHEAPDSETRRREFPEPKLTPATKTAPAEVDEPIAT